MKRILYVYLSLVLLAKAGSCGYLMIAGSSGLPPVIFAVSLLLAVSGAVVIVRHFAGKDKPNELTLYFMAFAIGTVFNIVFVNREVLSDIGFFEMMVTGNLFDIVLAAVAVLALWRQRSSQVEKQSFAAPAEEAVSKVN